MKRPERPPSLPELLGKLEPARLAEILTLYPMAQVDRESYPHWDRLRRLPAPAGLTHHEWWLATKFARQLSYRETPLTDREGKPFVIGKPDALLQLLARLDNQLGGKIGLQELTVNQDTRSRYVISSLMEEAVTSSQLEGAATTRADAIAMLRTGRKPRDRSERMILNNYLAMQRIGQLRNEPLTPDLVLELHAVVTEDTLDEAHSAGRMQTPTDLRVKVWDEQTGEILHDPPPADQLPDRLRLMCDFANGTGEAQGYLHPIVKAIVLHFWLAHDHPFADGNGRTARALFYWHMLREGYWLTEFISISSLIRKAPVKYARSFLWTETDANDMTYFVLAQLGIIAQSIDALENYIARKSSELRSVDQRLRALDRINHRQKALLAHALKNRHAVYSIQSHCRSHGVAYATGRADLLELCRLGLLIQSRQGKAFKFRVPDDLSSRLMLLEE